MTDSTATPTTDAVRAIERELTLSATPERVWRAISDPAELGRWFPDSADWDLRAGGTGSFNWKAYGAFAIRVEAVDPPKYLAFSWANEADTPLEKAEVTRVEWWVEPHPDGGTTLRLRESGFVRPEHRSGNDEGWTAEFDELVALLATA